MEDRRDCPLCGVSVSKYAFNRHLRSCDGNPSKFQGGEHKAAPVNDKYKVNGRYLCPYCGKEFSKLGIHTHIRTIHEGSHKGENNPHFNKKGRNHYSKGEVMPLSVRRKISESHKGLKLSKETKEKQSIAQSRLLEESGNGGFKNILYYSVSNIREQTFKVRGTWEYNFAVSLNEDNTLWVRRVYLSYYLHDGVKRTYCPDFYLPDEDRYIEIKGYFSDFDKKKMKAVEEQNNLIIEIWCKKDLEHHNII